jgi:serine phosphatase RsbU (regulator of sigma subunit)
MKGRLEWLAIIALAMLACGIVFHEAPRREPLPSGQAVVGAREIERSAEEGARAFGLELQSWKRYFGTRWNSDMELAFGQRLVEERWRLRHTGSYILYFFGPDQERCDVEMDLAGNVVSFERRSSYRVFGPLQGSSEEASAARDVALREFRNHWHRLNRPDAGEKLGFRLTADAVLEKDGYAFEWTSQPDTNGNLLWKLNFLIRQGQVIRYRLVPQPLDPLQVAERERTQPLQLLLLSTLLLGLTAVVAAPILTMLNLYRGRLPWSFVVRTAAMLGVLLALELLLGDWYEALHVVLHMEIADLVLFVLRSILVLGLVISIISAGRALRVSSDFRRWLGLEDFLRLKWNKASVTRSLVVAILVASIWLGISYAGLILVPSGMTDGIAWQAAMLRFPPIGGVFSSRSLSILLVVLFVFPLIKANLKSRKAQALLAVLLAAMASVFAPISDYPLALLLAEALLHGLLLVYAYHRFGVLASALGAILAPSIGRALIYLERGDAGLQVWGLIVLMVVVLFCIVRMVLDTRNPDWEREQRLSEREFEALRRERERRVVTRRERLLGEFALAEQAQQRMLPSKAPPVPGLSVSAVCLPAQQVAGDLFDYLQLADGRWGFCVADVSGKGVSAALYMTMVKGLLNSVRSTETDLPQMMISLNEHIYRNTGRRDFVTMILAAFDPRIRKLEVLRSGHPPMLLVSANKELRFLEPAGMGLGLVPSSLFSRKLSTETIDIRLGDVVVLYSDGVTEAMNLRREEFGEQRLAALVQSSVSKSTDAILQSILGGIREFQAGAPVHDDITLVVLKATDTGLTVTTMATAG